MPPSLRTLRRETAAGVTTFLTMSYVIVVNPAILSAQGTGIPFSGALTATVLVSAIASMAMGLYARLPYGVAPGMGMNVFFAYTLVLGRGVAWEVALGLVFWTGLLFLVLSVTPVRSWILQAIPNRLRRATAAGIGLLIAFLGLQNSGIVEADPATLVKLGSLGAPALLTMLGLASICALWRTHRAVAFLGSIAIVTLTGWAAGLVEPPRSWTSPPDLNSVFFALKPLEALQLSLLPAALSLLFTDLFDSLATFMGVSDAAGLVDARGRPKHLKKGLVVDAFATLSSGLFGTSPGTVYVESVSGIEAGGRTGWTSLVTGVCFLPFLFVAPLAGAVPAFATAPVLILVGLFMFRAGTIPTSDALEETLPAYLVILLIPLTFSITQGILWGLAAHSVLFVVAGRAREVTPFMYGLSLVAVALLYLETTQ